MVENAVTKTALVVSADEPMRDLIVELLNDSGFEAHPGDPFADDEEPPAVDVVLVDELDGVLDVEMIFEKLDEHSDRPAVVVLGDDLHGERIAACIERGVDEFLPKPFDPDELVARIHRADRYRRLERAVAPRLEGKHPIGFEGDLTYLNLSDILLNLHQNMQTGKLILDDSEGTYAFNVQKGELVKVVGPQGLEGKKAFYRALRKARGTFRFVVRTRVSRSKRYEFPNVANSILSAVQEADEYPLTRNKLPADPRPVRLAESADERAWPDDSVVRPLLEGLISATTVDILIHASKATDLEAAKEVLELYEEGVLIDGDEDAADRAS
jgi:DNA-binding response OmpR family regulator